MKNDKLAVLFKKYLNGDCTPDEMQTIEQWYQSHDMNPDDDRLGNTEDAKSLENKILGKIKNEISAQRESYQITSKKSRPFLFPGFYKVAASLLLLALVGAGAHLYTKNKTGEVLGKASSEVNSGIEKIMNVTPAMTTHRLSDGSVINLHPGGSIEFPRIFSKKQRDIHLTGEAFFDVAKEKDRPFIISTGEVTIRVLGTSFNVKAYEGSKEISVAVKTGKVSVSNKKSTIDEIILTPNQEVIYYTDQSNFSKKLVEDPQIILDKPTLFEMDYDGTPVDKIFDVLEENYGIDIVYDKTKLYGCSLTTSMSEEGLFERIEIICQAIGAQYEIKDGTINISSSGCQ